MIILRLFIEIVHREVGFIGTMSMRAMEKSSKASEKIQEKFSRIDIIKRTKSKRNLDSRIEQILRALEEDYSKLLTLKQASAFCSLSASRFRKLFLRQIGISYKEYINKKRYTQAIRYLKAGNLSIKQISFEIGYKSCPTFCIEFKKRIGTTPLKYRLVSK
jgi:YesN/AraC family two-component response regulator